MPSAPALGFVAIWSDDPPTNIVARLSEERPDVTSGYGGWEEVERPRRSTVTSWKGQPARRMNLGILLDGFATGTSVEYDIAQLESMALPREGGQPPTVKLLAQGGHVPYQNVAWVIEGLAWTDIAAMDAAGNRTRQGVTISLLEYVSDALIKARRRSPAQVARMKAAAQRKKALKQAARAKRKAVARSRKSTRKKAKKKTAHAGAHVATFAGDEPPLGTPEAMTVAVEPDEFDGEDLMSVAARELGDARRWREIADLNDIRDPRAVRVGQILRLP